MIFVRGLNLLKRKENESEILLQKILLVQKIKQLQLNQKEVLQEIEGQMVMFLGRMTLVMRIVRMLVMVPVNTADVSDGAGDSTAECLDKKVKFSKDDETTKKGGNKATPLAVIATKSSFKSKNVVPNLIFKIHNFSLELRTSLESIRTFYDKV